MGNKPARQPASEVMRRIQSGEVRMRPRSYFIALSVLSALLITVLGMVTAYAMSVIILWLRLQAAPGPAYGVQRSLDASADNFPWLALILAVVLISAMIVFVRRYGSAYRLRLSVVFTAVVAVAVVLGLVLSYTSLPARHLPQRSPQDRPHIQRGLN